MTCALTPSRQSVSDHAERARVQAHLGRAVQRLERAEACASEPSRRLVRALLLHELQRYRMRGLFPRNLDFARPTPYFVDAAGTRCAVAHLLELSGERALVRRIARERNHARVRELADEPRLVTWLTATGITLEEAAAIQPAYCVGGAPISCVCSSGLAGRPEAVIEGTVIEGTVIGSGGVNTRVHADAIRGSTARYQLGDELLVLPDVAVVPGAQVLVPVTRETGVLPDGGTYLFARVLEADGSFVCRGGGADPAEPLSVEQYSNAVLASDCAQYLKSLSPYWRTPCRKTGGDLGVGCASSVGAGDVPPSTQGVLLVLLSALALRRRRRAR